MADATRRLVKDRMAITWARWGLNGAEAVLKLRALRDNGDFDAYWQFHQLQDHERNHQEKYRELAYYDPDQPTPSQDPHLLSTSTGRSFTIGTDMLATLSSSV
jgi:hypothetical protein